MPALLSLALCWPNGRANNASARVRTGCLEFAFYQWLPPDFMVWGHSEGSPMDEGLSSTAGDTAAPNRPAPESVLPQAGTEEAALISTDKKTRPRGISARERKGDFR
jgi:hypothetical protein